MNDSRCGAKFCTRCALSFGLGYQDVAPGTPIDNPLPLEMGAHDVGVLASEFDVPPEIPWPIDRDGPMPANYDPDHCFAMPPDPNPKTLMGLRKLPVCSVVPPASILHEAHAMQYGAYEAPRADGSKGYGPYNWRDQAIDMMTYLDAAMRHIVAVVDGEDIDPQSGRHHLGHAKATLGIFLDAMENGTLIDNRPTVRKKVASRFIAQNTKKF